MEINRLKMENRILKCYSNRKRRLYLQSKIYTEYQGISLKSQKEIFHSEFYKFTQNFQKTRKEILLPLYQRYKSPFGTGYFYDCESEIHDPYKFRYRTDSFSKNQIVSLRHELNRQTISF